MGANDDGLQIYVDRFMEEQRALAMARRRLEAAITEREQADNAFDSADRQARVAFEDLQRAIEAAAKKTPAPPTPQEGQR